MQLLKLINQSFANLMLLSNVYIADISKQPIIKSFPVLRYKLWKNIPCIINFWNFSKNGWSKNNVFQDDIFGKKKFTSIHYKTRNH